MQGQRVVLVGGGHAAVSAAQTLRREGFDGEIVLVGEEELPPYERPPLSKAWLAGSTSPDDLLFRDRQWYADNAVELVLGTRVRELDCAGRRLTLADGSRLGYDRLLVATGGRPRRLPGVAGDRIRYLRTHRDAEQLRELLAPGEQLVVLGGGFVGCEVAATARAAGADVTILEMQPTVLQRALGEELGGVMADVHRSRGVRLRTGERVESVEEVSDGLVVRTDKGALECSALLVAVGMQRATELLAGTPVACDDGVLVDEYARTSVPGIYAAGDVTAAHNPRYGRRLRVEHDDNAKKQGAVAARNMLGHRVVYDDAQWFWSDQYEHSLQMAGLPDGHDQVVMRGSPEERCFSVFFLAGNRLLAVLAFDRGKDCINGRKLIAARAEVTAEQLKDESVDLRRLVPRVPGGA